MAGVTADDAGGQGGRVTARVPRGHAAEALTELFRDHHLELVGLALVMVGDLATACASRPAAWPMPGPASRTPTPPR